jgi:hypothetical protein
MAVTVENAVSLDTVAFLLRSVLFNIRAVGQNPAVKVAADTLTNDKGWPSILEVCRGANRTSP